VIPAYSYVEGMLPVISIPRSWIVDRDGVLMEELGFGRDGDKWLKRVLEMIQKAR
jgi:hypothetical protein